MIIVCSHTLDLLSFVSGFACRSIFFKQMPKEPLFQLEVDNFALYFDQVDKKCPLEVSCQFETQIFVNLKYNLFCTNPERTSFKIGLADPRADSASARAPDNIRKRLADPRKHRRWHLTTSEHMSLSKIDCSEASGRLNPNLLETFHRKL